MEPQDPSPQAPQGSHISTTSEPPAPIPDKPVGFVSRSRLAALAQRVGPSLDAPIVRSWLVWLLVMLFIAGVASAALLFLIQSYVHSKAELTVPDLRGKTAGQALDILEDLNLSLAKETVEVNESVPAGSILKQSPAPGMTVREGKVIRVTISSGGQSIFVPDLTNKTMQEAQAVAGSGGLMIGSVSEVFSQRYAAGWVLEQDPPAGAVAGRGQMVDLKVSKGPPPDGTVLMPDFVNQPVNEALSWLRSQGFEADVKEDSSSQALPGLVIAQAPAPDDVLKPGAKISLTVSPAAADGRGNVSVIRYQVPDGSGRVLVRVVVRDERGEREVFQNSQAPGSLVEAPVSIRGAARARIFVNGVLVEERPLE